MTRIRLRPIAGGCWGSPIACSAAAAMPEDRAGRLSSLRRGQDVRNPEAFLVTVVTRLCLDRLKSARAQREVYVGPWLPEPMSMPRGFARCGDGTRRRPVRLRCCSRSTACRRWSAPRSCCTTCSTCRFADVARMLDRTEAACRQLATRARRAVRDERPAPPAPPESTPACCGAFSEAVHQRRCCAARPDCCAQTPSPSPTAAAAKPRRSIRSWAPTRSRVSSSLWRKECRPRHPHRAHRDQRHRAARCSISTANSTTVSAWLSRATGSPRSISRSRLFNGSSPACQEQNSGRGHIGTKEDCKAFLDRFALAGRA